MISAEPDEHYAYNRVLSNLYFGQDGADSLLPDEQRVVMVVEPQRHVLFDGVPPPPTPEMT